MRKLIGGFAISLDGFIEGLNGEYDWMIMDEADINDSVNRYDCFLFGRRSYEKLGDTGGAFKGIDCIVFSETLTSVKPGYQLVKTETDSFISDWKKQKGKDIAIYGGAKLLTSLLNLNLVDELHFSVMPILIGEGKSMIDGLKERRNLELFDIKTFPSGLVKLFYNVKK